MDIPGGMMPLCQTGEQAALATRRCGGAGLGEPGDGGSGVALFVGPLADRRQHRVRIKRLGQGNAQYGNGFSRVA